MNFGTSLDIVAAIAGIAMALAALYASFAFVPQLWPSYLLIRYTRAVGPRNRRHSIVRELIWLSLQALGRLARGQAVNVFYTVRVRIEHEIFNPYPEFDAVKESLLTADHAAFELQRKQRRKDARAWRRKTHSLFWRGAPTEVSRTNEASDSYYISLATCNQIHDNHDAITNYLGQVCRIARLPMPEFLTQVKVESGFAAPLHLLTGLLHHFEDDWQSILDAYGRDIDPLTDPLTPILKRDDIRKLQTFLFDCWLLWGPSIPICDEKCWYWAGALGSVQYGYGDENNSIELIADAEFFRHQMKHLNTKSALAFRATVLGRLKRSTDIATEEKSRHSPALLQSWRTDKGPRAILDLRDGSVEVAAGELDESRATYYSAYLWVLFIISRDTGDAIEPVHVDQAWRGFLPFFEHGNVADKETYRFLKRQLAEKAIAGIARIVSQHEAKSGAGMCPVRFAYACAIDDSGCGMGKAYPSDADDVSLKSLLFRAIEREPVLKDHKHKIIHLDVYDADHHPYSACSMPALLGRYYESIRSAPK